MMGWRKKMASGKGAERNKITEQHKIGRKSEFSSR